MLRFLATRLLATIPVLLVVTVLLMAVVVVVVQQCSA